MTLQDALRHAAARFADPDTAVLDAQLMLCEAAGIARSRLYSHPEQELPDTALQRFMELCARRESGDPMAYILGRREFWSLDLAVAPGVLIPRPETELLVELALEFGAGQPGPVVDLGTGSGAIALALAHARPDWQVVAVEREPAALDVARTNLGSTTNVDLRAGSWCEPLVEHDFLLVVSNPPYLAGDDPHLDEGDVRFEPQSALVAADDGLADLRHLALTVPAHLRAQGWLLLEHGWTQGNAVRDLLDAAGFASVATYPDTGGRDRVTVGRWLVAKPDDA